MNNRFLYKLLVLFVSILTVGPIYADPKVWKFEWPDTDFSKTSVKDWSEILSGGPPKDGIPALSHPNFISPQKSNVSGSEPVITVALEGAPARAYPLRYLTWHEIVNDTIAGVPVAVTFCPLCNSARVFDRRIKGQELEFGVSGKLRHSDMVMYDRQTNSWWQQAIGRAIVGDLNGVKLQGIPTWVESFEMFQENNPTGVVMEEPSFRRPYGENPYVGYDRNKRPFLYRGEMPPHGINPIVRVIRVNDMAWPMSRLAQEQKITEAGITLEWQGVHSSPLDSAYIDEGRDIGSIRVKDEQGNDLDHDLMFAFAFHAFYPDGTWMLAK